jgi:signal transduction histidine kinase
MAVVVGPVAQAGVPAAQAAVWGGALAFVTAVIAMLQVSTTRRALAQVIDREARALSAEQAARESAAEQAGLQRALLDAQKMEALGRLAGGVAHDLNNLLTAMLGYANFIESEATQETVRADAVVVVDAAKRAADLTRQLLTFARRQAHQPRVFRIDDLVIQSHKLLRHLVPESVRLAVLPDTAGATVHATRGSSSRCSPTWSSTRATRSGAAGRSRSRRASSASAGAAIDATSPSWRPATGSA